MAASLSYIPEPREQAYYLGLFRTADVQGQSNIGGAQAVQFFARSKLPIEVLKNIWTVADQPSTSSLDHKKFAVAIRLIQLTQNGQKGTGPTLAAPPGVSLRPVFFEGVSGVSVQVPTTTNAAAAQPPPQQQQQQQMSSPPQPAGNRSPTMSPSRQGQQQQPSSPQRQQMQQQQQQTRLLRVIRPNALGSHNRQLSGFNAEYLMGGAAPPTEPDATDTEQHHHQQQQETLSVAARSQANSGDYGYDDQAFEIVDEMKKKARKADKAAGKAEAASRKLATEADELRNDADKAEAMSRSLHAASEEKKKGRFGGGKKKKLQGNAEQAAMDSAAIKKQFVAVQSQAYEAASLAATKRSEADRLREEAESAELQMASAASTAQQQPAQAPAPAPAPPANNNNGSYGHGVPSSKPDYGGMPPKQQPSPTPYGQGMQMMMPHPGTDNGGYNNYGQQQPYGGGAPAPMSLPNTYPGAANDGFAPMGGGTMGGGGGGDFAGYDLPSPSTFAPAPGMPPAADQYASPF
ncbi:hypothetical protein FRACYDRAFT_241535 [Fragilariopsis cylindrus CCMP1102]|uniref:EH domain-containing protein n=1 Tax=Fragilariopsis cylindrus CCMP1102 TaxID=635003 RepID=A0A1E7F4Z7_9STRA|nr:hypothetical protein FRACYDRAFT_241535 [Fragilariopsis cylindrus CCMP1102]|eukprot:OEU13204.1 hypothetical protein FRACYDRAFT_241535 [Fragilariopsis cylindrus CCMP1102]